MSIKEQIKARMSVLAGESRIALGNPVTESELELSTKWQESLAESVAGYVQALQSKQPAQLKDYLSPKVE